MPEDASERYADLERAYIDERWLHVQHEGEALLNALKGGGDPQSLALVHRVRLLIGHTALYGLGENNLAEDHYRAVLASTPEADLRRIAAEGLDLCLEPRSSTATRAAAETGTVAAKPLAADGTATAAALVAASQPESPRPPASGAAGQPDQRSAPAVTAPAEPAGLMEPSPRPSGSTSANALRPLPADPFKATPAAAGGAPSARVGVELPAPAMPWLQDQANRPAPQPQEPQTQGWPAAGSESSGPLAAPWLEVEVVEEPELVEVVQADPRLSEELELELSRIRERRAAAAEGMDAAQGSTPTWTLSETAMGPAQPGVTSAASDTAARQAEVGQGLAAAGPLLPDGVVDLAATAVAAVQLTDPVPPIELAAATPVPLALEDPDLIAGLLEVNLRD